MSLFAAVRICSAQADPWASVTFADPLRFSSLPISGTEAIVPAAGEWELSSTMSYFNVWQRSWHTATIHKEFGLQGQPLQPWEIALLAQRHPADQFYHIDLEGWRDDVVIARGFGGGVAATLQIPWVGIGAPHWDDIAERFHATFGLGNMNRQVFPRGQSTVVVRGHGQILERFTGLPGSGLGDIRLSVTGPLGSWLGAEQRWAVAVEAPTGRPGTLRGSGGWDWGVRWFATWGQGRTQVRAGLGYSVLAASGSWLGVRRDNIWGALVEVHTPLGRRLTFRASARCDSSPLASFTSSDIGKVSSYWTVGVLRPVAGRSWIAFDLGENYGSVAEVPDFSFHLQFGTRFGH